MTFPAINNKPGHGRIQPAKIFANLLNGFLSAVYSRGMKQFLLLFAVFGTLFSRGQAPVNSQVLLVKPGQLAVPVNGASTATTQAANWESLVAREPRNAEAWFNYYIWTSRRKELPAAAKQAELGGILSRAGNQIGGQPQFDMMQYLFSGKKDTAGIHRVIAAAGNKTSLYPWIIEFFMAEKNDSALQKYCTESETINPLPKSIYSYYYNTLMSAEKNASIYAKGVNDLVPMAILQQVYAVRKDISLQEYNGEIDKGSSAYLSITLGKELLVQYPQASYTGLLVKISGTHGIEELKDHIENDFDLSFLDNNKEMPPDAAALNKNYLPSLILLYRYYKKKNDPKSEKIKELIRKIAGNTDDINDMIVE